ncbi:MAG: hypothetical protein WHS88_00975 [Anaerohalosphaeraceae bacterium]
MSCLIAGIIGGITVFLLIPLFLAITLPLLVRLEGQAYLWAVSILEIVIIIIVYSSGLFILLKSLKNNKQLTVFFLALFVNTALIVQKYQQGLHIQFMLELIIEVLLICILSLICCFQYRAKTEMTPKQ